MKSLSIIFSIILLAAFTACNHFSIMDSPWHKNFAKDRMNPPELNAFADASADAAKILAQADSVSDWQTEYDKVTELRNQLPEERLNKTQQKSCDSIMEQMEMGKMAIQLKKVDPKMGKKQCTLVSTEISNRVKILRNPNSKAKA